MAVRPSSVWLGPGRSSGLSCVEFHLALLRFTQSGKAILVRSPIPRSVLQEPKQVATLVANIDLGLIVRPIEVKKRHASGV